MAAVLREAARVLPAEVRVAFAEKLDAPETKAFRREGAAPDASWDPRARVVSIALDARNPRHSFDHEVVHALRSLGLFTSGEWKLLEDAARREGWIESARVRKRYEQAFEGQTPGDVELLLIEEAIAERYATGQGVAGSWTAGERTVGAAVGRLFRRIGDFLERVRDGALDRLGLAPSAQAQNTVAADDVFRRIASGEIAERTPGPSSTPGGPRYSVPDAPDEEILVRAPILVPDEAPVLRADPEPDHAETLGEQWDRRALDPSAPNHGETRLADHGRDPRQEFAEALREAGLELNGLPEMDGRLYRVRAAGDGRGERSGWYVGHADGHPAGAFGDWRTGANRLWKSQRSVTALGAADRARLRAETAQRRLEREQQAEMQHEAAVDAIAAHLGMAVPATADHPYLASKGVGANGVFLDLTGSLVLPPGDPEGQRWSARGALLIPVRDMDGALIGAQSVGPDGFKAFARGGRLNGGGHLLGDLSRRDMVLIAEGYATAATLHEATGLPVMVAFTAGNLKAVARGLHERWPDKRIVVAGDNDHRRERETVPDGRPKRNVGREKAEAAAAAVGGFALIPRFAPDDAGSDWNDLAEKGPNELQAQLQTGLAAAQRHYLAREFEPRRHAGRTPEAERRRPPARQARGR